MRNFLFKALGFTGPIDAMRMIDVTNLVVSSFFDRNLKGEPVSRELLNEIPELVSRHHSVRAR